jgi:S-DNA-T family DNA segregation ATPase FtsK/SpoIIIE
VTPLDWATLGEPPASRTVRELGNGPTDLALLASALQRAAESLGTPPVPRLV